LPGKTAAGRGLPLTIKSRALVGTKKTNGVQREEIFEGINIRGGGGKDALRKRGPGG